MNDDSYEMAEMSDRLADEVDQLRVENDKLREQREELIQAAECLLCNPTSDLRKTTMLYTIAKIRGEA